MAGNFAVLEEFQDDALTLPVRLSDGLVKEFRIPSPSAEDGLKVQKLMEQGARMADSGTPMDAEVLDDAQELDLFQTALGSAYVELMGAGLDWSRVRHVAMTAVMWITAGLEMAEKYWEAQGDPSRVAPPNRAARRAASSAAASTTKRRGSTSGTSTRTATGRARKAAKT
ncbi:MULTISPECIES: hypothetical protein [unclassified Streptomyces]|uniref:DUF7426 family protein n=1 Tax=unclassified Streptomyces TaxID=2593676 RepID=UPI002285713B|nr:hypothetical protein [Streptomyces sp. Je 1-369]WAL94002.1 hypothetical protein NOO62_05485 [Streptomyces sp. Je 1-369]